MEIQVALNGD